MYDESQISPKELLAIFIARDLQDGEFVPVGANSPIPRAGVMLAHMTHCPNLRILLFNYAKNLLNERKLAIFEFTADGRYAPGSEASFSPDDQFSSLRFFDAYFVGGMQIDMYGNTNLIGIGRNYKKLDLRGPGSAGIPTASTHSKRYYIFSNSHNKRVFTKKCDYISTVGWHKGGADARAKLGLPGGGPKYVLTPMCVMDFTEQGKRMRLKMLLPNVTAEQVLKNTGFDLAVADRIEKLSATDEEITLLREKVDPEGILR
jgi:glutaconate CoA-transferase subunit B